MDIFDLRNDFDLGWAGKEILPSDTLRRLYCDWMQGLLIKYLELIESNADEWLENEMVFTNIVNKASEMCGLLIEDDSGDNSGTSGGTNQGLLAWLEEKNWKAIKNLPKQIKEYYFTDGTLKDIIYVRKGGVEGKTEINVYFDDATVHQWRIWEDGWSKRKSE